MSNRIKAPASPNSRKYVLGSFSKPPINRNAPSDFNKYSKSGYAGGVRRSSAAGLSRRPPLPTNINSRRHSLDVLASVDNSADEECNNDSKNSKNSNKNDYQNATEVTKSKEIIMTKATNRRSRSLDDLLDSNEDSLLCADEDDHTRSLENMQSSGEIPYEKPCEHEVITVDNSIQMHDSDSCLTSMASHNDDSGIQCSSFEETVENVDNEDSRSNTESIASIDHERKPKTFLNRYVKKVKSFIKK